jgi:dihydroorotase
VKIKSRTKNPGASGAMRFTIGRCLWSCVALLGWTLPASAQDYDLLLEGGHVIDAKNGVSAVRDVAMKDGRIAAVAANIDPKTTFKVVDVSGLYVTPGSACRSTM